MLIMRALLVAAALCVAAPAFADDQPTPAPTQGDQVDQAGKQHSSHHHHKKQQDGTDSTSSPSQGH